MCEFVISDGLHMCSPFCSIFGISDGEDDMSISGVWAFLVGLNGRCEFLVFSVFGLAV